MAYLSIVGIVDRILENRWYDFEKNLYMSESASSVFMFVKFLFKLHAIFNGSFSAERLAGHAEAVLMKILDLNKGKQALPEKDITSLGIRNR